MAIIDLLQKLMKQEQSARLIGNQAEAEAFAGKVAELLFKHKLEMSDIEIEDEVKAAPVGRESLKVRDYWKNILAVGVTKATFCHSVKGGSILHIIGSADNRAACISLFNYLCDNGEAAAKVEVFKWRFVGASKHGRTVKNNFLMGFASAIVNRINADIRRLSAEAEAAYSAAPQMEKIDEPVVLSKSTALMYVDKNKAAIDEYNLATFGKLRKGSSRRFNFSRDAYESGKAHGNKVALNSRGALE